MNEDNTDTLFELMDVRTEQVHENIENSDPI